MTISTGLVTPIAGGTVQYYSDQPLDGIGTAVVFEHPVDVALDAAGTFALVVSRSTMAPDHDRHNHPLPTTPPSLLQTEYAKIRFVDISSRRVTTLAGNRFIYGCDDGVGAAANFMSPAGVTIDSFGTFALVVSWRGLGKRGHAVSA